MSVSVAMATYNGEKYLREQLDSIACQTYLPCELVICDDGSSDDTVRIITDFASSAPFPVRLHVNPERLDYRRNFMHCADLCVGDLIAFSDQDDIWRRNKLEIQAACFIEQPGTVLSFHNADLIDSDGFPIGGALYAIKENTIFKIENCNPFLVAWGFTQVFRRDLLVFKTIIAKSKERLDYKDIMSHDHFIFFLATICGSVVYTPVFLAAHRRHELNTTGQLESRFARIYRKTADRRAEYDRLLLVWQNRVDLIRQMSLCAEQAAMFDPELQLQLGRSIKLYSSFRDKCRRRSEFYHASSFVQKLSLLLRAIKQGDYASGNLWGFQKSGLLRDIVMMVIPDRNRFEA